MTSSMSNEEELLKQMQFRIDHFVPGVNHSTNIPYSGYESSAQAALSAVKAHGWRPVGVDEIVVPKELFNQLVTALVPHVKPILISINNALKAAGFKLPE